MSVFVYTYENLTNLTNRNENTLKNTLHIQSWHNKLIKEKNNFHSFLIIFCSYIPSTISRAVQTFLVFFFLFHRRSPSHTYTYFSSNSNHKFPNPHSKDSSGLLPYGDSVRIIQGLDACRSLRICSHFNVFFSLFFVFFVVIFNKLLFFYSFDGWVKISTRNV